jgi:Fe-S cluster biogenesis protein NfuA
MIDRLESLLARFDVDQTPRQAREQAEQIARTIISVYGDGIERMLSIVHSELGDRSEVVFDRLCEDKLVESLLCLHGLHPVALEDRVRQALESVLPYVQSHKGNMEISRIEGDVVYLRLEGSCDGCPASATTLKLAVERAILERVPEIREVRAQETAGEVETTLRILSPV